jgi:hypothetical protein
MFDNRGGENLQNEEKRITSEDRIMNEEVAKSLQEQKGKNAKA